MANPRNTAEIRNLLTRAHGEAQARRFTPAPLPAGEHVQRVLSLLAARRSQFPLVAAANDDGRPFGGDAA